MWQVRVPSFLRRTFTLLHSYMLVKKLVKRGDHQGAARMLLRISDSISKFPSHKASYLSVLKNVYCANRNILFLFNPYACIKGSNFDVHSN